MRGLRTLMLILLAAAFAVGGPLRAPPCHAEIAPPCHEMAMDMAGDMAGMAMPHKAPPHKSKSDILMLSCCAGCLPAAARDLAPDVVPGVAVRIAFTSLNQAFDGQSLAPDHGPPRPFA